MNWIDFFLGFGTASALIIFYLWITWRMALKMESNDELFSGKYEVGRAE